MSIKMSLKDFDCMDCGVDTLAIHEYYTVHDHVWLLAHPDDYGDLCIGCLEKRLGRTLTPEDFPNYPVNTLFQQSERLRNRIGVDNGIH